jgi:predicted MFS family arabinose efflux permease
VLLSFSVLELAAHWLLAVVLGAMLLDFGLRAAMVANQTLVNSIQPDARSRFNTIFGLAVWSGNATGAALASLAFREWGWSAVCALSLSASVIALLLQWLDHRRHAVTGSAA